MEPHPAGILPSHGRLFKTWAAVAAAYVLAGLFGLAVPFTSGNVSPVWPPAGIALAAVLLWGPRMWPAIALAALLVNAVTLVPAWSAVGIAVGNTLGPLAGGWLLRRLAFDPPLGRLRDVFRLVAAGAFGGTVISATIGTAVLAAAHVQAWTDPPTAWLVWWLGDAMGVLVAAPLVLSLPVLRSLPLRALGEMAGIVSLAAACSVLVFHAHPVLGAPGYSLVGLAFPFLLLWGATRFQVIGASLITASIAGVAIWAGRDGIGPFAIGPPLRSAGMLQSFIAVIAVAGLSVAALTLERARLVRQRAEREAALRSEERFREIAETANEGVWMLDPALLTCFVNHRLARMLGYTPEEMLGKPVTAFVFEADAQGKLAQLERRRHGMSEQLETRYRRKDGSEVWAEVSATGSFDPAGRFTGVLAMISDITEQKRREAEGRVSRQEILLLTRVVEQTADSVLVTDRDGVIEYVNPAFETTTGYTKEEAIGRRPSILKSGRHDQDFYRTLWDELLEGRTFSGTLVNRKKNGGLYWAQQTITPIRDDEGAITHFVSVLKDVTELRRRHEQEVQLRLAHEVQRRFYQDPAPVPGFDLAAVSCPATETGGDYFDFIPAADGSFYLAVGDASGHGLGAALVMALTRAYVRSLVALDLGVGDVLTRVNRMLVADLEANRFVTLLLARIDGGGALHYANAGHVPGIVLGADGGEQAHATMPSTGTPLGLFPEAAFSEGQVSLQRDETLVLVTDGVTESAGQDGDQFGMDRLVECVQSHGHQPARTIAEGICQAALHFAGEEAQADDLTAVVARRC